MRAAQRILYVLAAVLIVAAVLPGGTLALFVAGLVLLFAATGCAITADNDDIKFGRGLTRRPEREASSIR
jgi:uncharacterized protein (DUF58 family)